MKSNQQGSSLIIVIWFIAITGVIVTFLFYRTELEWASVVNLESKQRYLGEAETVLHKCLELLVADKTAWDSFKDDWYGNNKDGLEKDDYKVNLYGNGRFELERNGYTVTVIIEDEGSKLNLNTISDKQLQYIVELAAGNASLPSGSGDTIENSDSQSDNQSSPGNDDSQQSTKISADPVLDWRDFNTDQRPEGAELSYYQGLNPPYKPRDGCFSSLEDLKQVKNGDQLYPILAPVVTLFGKANPNIISGEIFAGLIGSATDDYKTSQLETIRDNFEQYRKAQNRFSKADDLLQVGGISFGPAFEKIKPLFQYTGSCNINTVTQNTLTVILKEAGYNDSAVVTLINHQKNEPYENVRDIYTLLGYNEAKPEGKPKPDDYFTVTSTIIRYRIWVSKGPGRYYLDTVWERQLIGLKKEWRINPLSRRELTGNSVPEIPPAETTGAGNDDNENSPEKDNEDKDLNNGQ